MIIKETFENIGIFRSMLLVVITIIIISFVLQLLFPEQPQESIQYLCLSCNRIYENNSPYGGFDVETINVYDAKNCEFITDKQQYWCKALHNWR